MQHGLKIEVEGMDSASSVATFVIDNNSPRVFADLRVRLLIGQCCSFD